MLISNLARHTANLAKDPRASIMVDETGALADPLQGARVTVWGRAEKDAEEGVRRRFLARHPEAAFYADFPDFAFWRLAVDGGALHRRLRTHLRSLSLAISWWRPKAPSVSSRRSRHRRAYEQPSRRCRRALREDVGASAGAWRMTGIDPEGCDIVLNGAARRILFAGPCAHTCRGAERAGEACGGSAVSCRTRLGSRQPHGEYGG
jgi:hypothetical protein